MMDGAIVKYLEADVRCYHCGQWVGVLRRATGSSAAARAFRRHADGAWIVVRALASLRCDRCDGPLYAEPFMEQFRYRLALDQDRPCRGRPRKQLNGRPEVNLGQTTIAAPSPRTVRCSAAVARRRRCPVGESSFRRRRKREVVEGHPATAPASSIAGSTPNSLANVLFRCSRSEGRPSSTIRPSSSTATLSACSTVERRWAISTIVCWPLNRSSES